MDPKKLIYNVIKLYQSARIPKFRNSKIKRGRSRAIAQYFEDLFALFLVDNIKCDRIYIDQSFSISGVKTNYPDISVLRNSRITSFCDLKIDMGWNRYGLKNLCKHHFEWLQKVRGKICTLRDGETKEIISHKISEKASYNIVILSERNINPQLLHKQINAAEIFSPTVEVFVLTSGEHPNSYGVSSNVLLKKVEILYLIFKKLINKLNK